MKTFKYLTESANEEKLTHLEHAEDHHLNAGEEGAKHAVNTLRQTAAALRGEPSTANIMTKYDGSPSIIFGYHPENKKFFVASKSAFNKTPKINYSLEDIKQNHGHAPGLVEKLSVALEHLPKVTPKGKIFQADIMHTNQDIQDDGSNVSFKPNTITYSSPSSSPLSQQIKKSKIGVAVHTGYTGTNFENMKATYGTDISDLRAHNDVHIIPTQFKANPGTYTDEDHTEFNKHIQSTSNIMRSMRPSDYDVLNDHDHRNNIKTYINSTIRNNTKPSTDDYKSYLRERASIDANKVKTDSSKKKKIDMGEAAVTHIDANGSRFDNILNLHHHMQQAKNVLVKSMARQQDFNHEIAGQKTGPEGFVSVIDNRPTKLTDRYEFNRMNFLRNRQ